ncbi:ATP-binding protein [Streptacidiphilus sp. PAMC 29251]
MASPQEPFPLSRASYSLNGMSGCIATARQLAGAFLGTQSQAGADALLLVSELVTNATRHAPGPCELSLSDDGTQWTIAVSDTSPAMPQPRAPDLVAGGGGFGWHLLQTLAATVQLTPTEDGGKTVTATVPYPDRSTAP